MQTRIVYLLQCHRQALLDLHMAARCMLLAPLLHPVSTEWIKAARAAKQIIISYTQTENSAYNIFVLRSQEIFSWMFSITQLLMQGKSPHTIKCYPSIFYTFYHFKTCMLGELKTPYFPIVWMWVWMVVYYILSLRYTVPCPKSAGIGSSSLH